MTVTDDTAPPEGPEGKDDKEREAPPGAVFRTLEPFILASASPRRSSLLRSVGLAFDVIPSGTGEELDPSEPRPSPDALVKQWAEEKALAVSRIHPDRWVLSADTMVVLGGTVFGKPADADEAVLMLRRLSGRTHEVMTGVCLMHSKRRVKRIQSVVTGVVFKDLTREEVLSYVATGEPLDKAGAYGIQGIGAFLVRRISGSYTNVVGLPLCETLEWMTKDRIIRPAADTAEANRKDNAV